MPAIALAAALLVGVLVPGDPPPQQADRPADAAAIKALLDRQQADWNRGDVGQFMTGYERTPALVFTSGGRVERGWDAALARYRRTYPNRDAMGRLEFSDLEVTLLGSDSAVVLGRYSLARKTDNPRGVFTLVLRKGAAGWKIVHDHTSSSAP